MSGNYMLMIIVFILGLILGSFYNVVALRIPKQQSIVYPPSHCPTCQHRLRPWELIPVVSWLLQGGKCTHCHAPISPLYMVGEGCTGITFLLLFEKFGLQWETLVGIVSFSFLIILMVSDLRYMLLPNPIVYSGIFTVLLLRLMIHPSEWWQPILGAALCFISLLLIAIVSKGGIGGGDIKLYALIGLLLGPGYGIISLFLSACYGTLIGYILKGFGILKKQQPIPFVPFIFLGTLTTYLYGHELWNWYITLF
jgi:leader peptidase (prepilin peptidase)/N-methyltransferase